MNEETKSTAPIERTEPAPVSADPRPSCDEAAQRGFKQSPTRRSLLGRSGKLIAYSTPVIVMLVPSRALAAYSVS